MRLNLSSDGTSKRPRTTRRLQAPGDDQSSVESDHGHGADRLDKPRQSQPVGGMRFTSQTGRRHDGTLDQLASSPAHLIQVGGSLSGVPPRAQWWSQAGSLPASQMDPM